MSYIAKPSAHHPALPKNTLGLTRRDYEGTMSTLCAGCGHDSITAALIEACFEMDLPAHRIAKVSGIGCSSKAPTYFLVAQPRLQLRARAHAVGHDRRRTSPTATSSTSAYPATATPPRSGSASSATPCAGG